MMNIESNVKNSDKHMHDRVEKIILNIGMRKRDVEILA